MIKDSKIDVTNKSRESYFRGQNVSDMLTSQDQYLLQNQIIDEYKNGDRIRASDVYQEIYSHAQEKNELSELRHQ